MTNYNTELSELNLFRTAQVFRGEPIFDLAFLKSDIDSCYLLVKDPEDIIVMLSREGDNQKEPIYRFPNLLDINQVAQKSRFNVCGSEQGNFLPTRHSKHLREVDLARFRHARIFSIEKEGFSFEVLLYVIDEVVPKTNRLTHVHMGAIAACMNLARTFQCVYTSESTRYDMYNLDNFKEKLSSMPRFEVRTNANVAKQFQQYGTSSLTGNNGHLFFQSFWSCLKALADDGDISAHAENFTFHGCDALRDVIPVDAV